MGGREHHYDRICQLMPGSGFGVIKRINVCGIVKRLEEDNRRSDFNV